ncbi:MAG: type II secretion system protein GspM [Alphaproteobacteria bacterium]|nr:type II secretion system protein GspM [Alphaproteobacteria bacterium]
MTAGLSPGVQRFLAVAILMLVALGAWRLIASPIMAAHRNYDDSIAQSQELLSKYLRIAQSRSELERVLKRVQVRKSAVGRFLEGDEPDLVAAKLQSRIKRIVGRHDGRLKSTRFLRPRDEAEFRQVVVSANMSASADALLNVLYELETANPYLFVDRLHIRSPARVRAKANAKAPRVRKITKPASQDLSVRWEVHGYMGKEAL